MSEPSQGQRSAAEEQLHAQVPRGSPSGNGGGRAANGTDRRTPGPHPLDAPDLFADLAAACVPTFCDGLHFNLVADGTNGLRASFPAAPERADTGATDEAVAVGGHAQQCTAPGRLVIAVQTELADGHAPVVGTIVCTWHDSSRPTEADALVARLLAEQAAARLGLESLGSALQKLVTRAANLEEALATNREIGQAIGILMATHHVTAEQAFERLRTASQHTHRKLREIAADVTETGVLTLAADLPRGQVQGGPTAEGRAERHTTQRVQRRTRGGQPVAATPDEA